MQMEKRGTLNKSESAMNKYDAKIFLQVLSWCAIIFGTASFVAEFFRPGYIDAFVPVFIPWIVAAAAAIGARQITK